MWKREGGRGGICGLSHLDLLLEVIASTGERLLLPSLGVSPGSVLEGSVRCLVGLGWAGSLARCH